jgi:hypothetical protein
MKDSLLYEDMRQRFVINMRVGLSTLCLYSILCMYAALLFPVVIIKTDHEDEREGLEREGLEEEGLEMEG